VLKVRGDSMCEFGILDGDYVVIEQRETARDGEIVVALAAGEEVTLKRILQQPGRTILYPENSAMEALELVPREVQIQGLLVGQMRSYR
jgi:repressor LexA